MYAECWLQEAIWLVGSNKAFRLAQQMGQELITNSHARRCRDRSVISGADAQQVLGERDDWPKSQICSRLSKPFPVVD